MNTPGEQLRLSKSLQVRSYQAGEANVADRWQGYQDLPLQEVLPHLARNVGHREQPADGQLQGVRGRSRQSTPA